MDNNSNDIYTLDQILKIIAESSNNTLHIGLAGCYGMTWEALEKWAQTEKVEISYKDVMDIDYELYEMPMDVEYILIWLAQKNNKEAKEKLYNVYKQKITSIVKYKIKKNKVVSGNCYDDLISDAYVIFFENINNVNLYQAYRLFNTVCFRIAINNEYKYADYNNNFSSVHIPDKILSMINRIYALVYENNEDAGKVFGNIENLNEFIDTLKTKNYQDKITNDIIEMNDVWKQRIITGYNTRKRYIIYDNTYDNLALAEDEYNVEDTAIDNLYYADMMKCLNNIDPKYKEILILKFDTNKIKKIGIKMSKNDLLIALNALKNEMEKEGIMDDKKEDDFLRARFEILGRPEIYDQLKEEEAASKN